jgi:hypothetical protein
VEHHLYVLGADPPALPGLGPAGQSLDQIGTAFDGRGKRIGAGHGKSREERRADNIAGEAESNPFIANRR